MRRVTPGAAGSPYSPVLRSGVGSYYACCKRDPAAVAEDQVLPVVAGDGFARRGADDGVVSGVPLDGIDAADSCIDVFRQDGAAAVEQDIRAVREDSVVSDVG